MVLSCATMHCIKWHYNNRYFLSAHSLQELTITEHLVMGKGDITTKTM